MEEKPAVNFLNLLTPEERDDYYSLKSNEAKRLFHQYFFKKNFEAFVYLLGYRDLGAFHRQQIYEIAKERELTAEPARRLWLWARGHYKTSLITISHSIWLIVNNPDIRILLVSNTLDIAKKIFADIKHHFVGNSDFRYFFREFVPKPNIDGKVEFGTTEAFTIPYRVKTSPAPTLMCAGIGTNLTGLHFDYMKIDDLVTKDSVSNDTQILASKEYYAYLRPLFDNPTIPREDVIGTPYHFNDLYDANNGGLKNHKEFRVSFIPAKDGDGRIKFPERFSEDGLSSILSDPSVGPYAYSAQFMLNPINPADVVFKDEWWDTYDKIPEGCADYILVDPASVQKKKSDYTVIMHWKRDWKGNDYLVEGIRDKLTVFQRIDKVVALAKRCPRLVELKYEVLGGRHGDLETLKLRCIQENLPITPKETKSTTSSKQDRIRQRLVGMFHAKKVLFPESSPFKSEYDGKVYDFVREYKLEYLQFPQTEHDDCLDCHSFLYEDPAMLQNGLKPKEEVEKKGMTADEEDAFYSQITNMQSLNPFYTKEQVYDKLRRERYRRLFG